MSNPRIEAQKVLDIYWNGNFPVDPVKIAWDMGVNVYSLNEPGTDLSGTYDPRHPAFNGMPTILINLSEAPVRQRFTIAHELGHHVLHGTKSFRDPINQLPGMLQEEVDANAFAAALLMPEKYFVSAFHSALYSDKQMCSIFGVSKAAMGWRLKNLGYKP